jgi:hypothetical protein
MRSAILNGTTPQTLTSAEEFAALDPASTIVTSDPARVGTETFGPSTRAQSFDAAKLEGWIRTGAAIQSAGNVALGGVDFRAMLAFVGTGASVGSSIPVLGTIAGAVIGAVAYVIQWAVNRPPTAWASAAPGVHAWFTEYGPQEYLNWVRAENTALLGGTVADLVKGLALYWIETYGAVITDRGTIYPGVPNAVYFQQVGGADVLAQLYLPMGIDYPKTRAEAYPAGTVVDGVTSQGLGGVWMLNRKVYVGRVATNITIDKGPQKDSDGGLLTLGLLAAGAYALSQQKTA